VRWFEAHPDRLARELDAMSAYPALVWNENLTRVGHQDGGGWTGRLPSWPFQRPRPPELDAFLAGATLEAVILCLQAHPAVKPRIYPTDPEPDLGVRTMNAWHVAGDGSLCLSQRAYDWDGSETAAELVPKAAGWFLEYLLLDRGHVETMTEVGLVGDDALDHLFTAANAQPRDPDGST
jgi:hypothetical protein